VTENRLPIEFYFTIDLINGNHLIVTFRGAGESSLRIRSSNYPQKGSSRRIARKESPSTKRVRSDPKCNLRWSTDYVIRQQTAQNGVPADRVSISHTHTYTHARTHTRVSDSPVHVRASKFTDTYLFFDNRAGVRTRASDGYDSFRVTLTLVAEVFIESNFEYKWGE